MKCRVHNLSEAKYYCEACGFLCDSDVKSETNINHCLIKLKDNISPYITAAIAQYTNNTMAKCYTEFITYFSANAHSLFYKHKTLQIQSQNLLKQLSCKLSPQIDVDTLSNHITTCINTQLSEVISKRFFDSVTLLLKDSIKHIENYSATCRINIPMRENRDRDSTSCSMFMNIKDKQALTAKESNFNNKVRFWTQSRKRK
jgi:hypothetical protein